MPINYVKGDATSPQGTSPRVLVHVCNDLGAWGKGFVVAVSKKWPAPEQSYRDWHKKEADVPFALGQVQFVEVEPSLWVANLIGQHGLRSSGEVPPIRYEAVREGLRRVAEFAAARRDTVHMPRIGCGLAGGSWDLIAPIIEEEVVGKGLDVTVYDFA